MPINAAHRLADSSRGLRCLRRSWIIKHNEWPGIPDQEAQRHSGRHISQLLSREHHRCHARGANENYDEKRTRKGAVNLGFCGFLTFDPKNKFRGRFLLWIGVKGRFLPSKCYWMEEFKRPQLEWIPTAHIATLLTICRLFIVFILGLGWTHNYSAKRTKRFNAGSI